jgi:hypothetical protein
MKWTNKNKTRMIDLGEIVHYCYTENPVTEPGRKHRLWLTLTGGEITLYDEDGLEVFNLIKEIPE